MKKKMIKKGMSVVLFLSIVSLICLTGCFDSEDNNSEEIVSGSPATPASPELTLLEIFPVNPSIAKGTNQQFIATGTYTNGSTRDLTSLVNWESSNKNIVQINEKGLATGITAGESVITATGPGIEISSADSSGDATLTVTTATLQSIQITPAISTLPVGLGQQFAATGTYTDDSTRVITSEVTWGSSDKAVADIDAQSGFASSVTLGSTIISATDPIKGISSSASYGDATLNFIHAPKIVVGPVNGLVTTEAGGINNFSIVLNTKPNSNVTIGISSGDVTEALISGGDSPVTPADFLTLTFTPSNWSTPQTVSVIGQDDDIIDGNQTFSIITDVAVSTDTNYSGINPTDVAITNNDNDSAGISVNSAKSLVTNENGQAQTFTVVLNSQPGSDVYIDISTSDITEGLVSKVGSPDAPAELIQVTFTLLNWSDPQTVKITGWDDDIIDGKIIYTIVTSAAVSGDTYYSGINPANISVTNNDNDAAGFSVTPTSGLVTTEGGDTDTFTISLNSKPDFNVSIDVYSSDITEGWVSALESQNAPVHAMTVTFTPANWSIPRIITVIGQNDDVIDDNQSFIIITGQADTTDQDYQGLDPADVSVTNNDNDVVRITANPSAGLVVDENQGQTTFTVVLNTKPDDNVTIGVSTSDVTEVLLSGGNSNLPVETILLAFTPGDWQNPKTVTVTGQKDYRDDGNQNFNIIVGSSISSGDNDYSTSFPLYVPITVIDNDVASVFISRTSGLVTTENGWNSTFTIQLTSMPTDNVTFDLSSSDTSEGLLYEYSLNSYIASITRTFTPFDWENPQTIMVWGKDDLIADGNIEYSIITSSTDSNDPVYRDINPADISVTNNDNDVVDIIFSPTLGLVTTEQGGMATFTVQLATEPFNTVNVDLSSTDIGEGLISGGNASVPSETMTLTFGPNDWRTPKTVTVTGVDDSLTDGNIPFTITTSAVTSLDSDYDGFIPTDVSVTNNDDEIALISPSGTDGLQTTEDGGTATFYLTLSDEPMSDVIITLSSSDTGTGTVPASITITPQEWSTNHPVTVTGVDNAIIGDGDQVYTITATPSGDLVYSGAPPVTITLTNTDNDGPRYVLAVITDIHYNEIVQDRRTGLLWQRRDMGTTASWDDTVIYCANLSIEGFASWRLPTKHELIDLWEDSYLPHIDPIFSNWADWDYWSSTTEYGYGYTVRYGWRYGYGTAWLNKGNGARCVRAGQ